MELLFRQILGIPTASVDVTAYSETGYVGEDVNSIITRLLFASAGDPLKTKVGMAAGRIRQACQLEHARCLPGRAPRRTSRAWACNGNC